LLVKRYLAFLAMWTMAVSGVLVSVALPTGSASALASAPAAAGVASLAAAVSTAGGFTGTTPTRVLNTVTGVGAAKAKLGAGRILTLKVPGLPAGTTAVAINVTATTPTLASYLTVYQGGTGRPGAGNLSFVAGQTIANLVIVPVGPAGTVSIYNRAGTVNVLGDLVGYLNPARGAGFTGRAPLRVLNTVTGVGAAKAKLGAGRILTLKVPGLPAGTTAVAINVTATTATAASYLTVYPGPGRPGGSNLNFAAGQTVANLVLVPVGAGNTVTFYNRAGTVNVLGDLVGSFTPSTATGAGLTGKAPVRVLNTVTGVGAAKAKLGAGRTLTLKVPGLPAGATAVAINVTATTPTLASYLTVYQGGSTTRPGVASLSFPAGRTVANLVLVPLGAGNTVTFYNRAGTVNVLGDVVGYVEPGTPVTPTTAVLAVTNSSVAVTSAATGSTLFFDPSASLAGPAGTALQSASLDYGDGTTPEAFTGDPTAWFSFHSYATAGDKTVTLTVTDSAGKTATVVVTIHVFDVPTAAITATGQAQAGVPFTFTLDATTPAGTTWKNWTVSGGGLLDGGWGAGPPPTYTTTFTDPGTHTITFTVSNSAGGDALSTLDITVNP